MPLQREILAKTWLKHEKVLACSFLECFVGNVDDLALLRSQGKVYGTIARLGNEIDMPV
jgi:hypothetical protein